jgi:RNA polymerase sigma-70 factor (ECF subfamily)
MSVQAQVPEADTAKFQAVRRRLFGIGYRVLGSADQAEDVVQDAWIRWQGVDRSKVRDSAAFLATTTTRLAINAGQSARVRRETYIGTWLTEPADAEADPARGVEQTDALESAVLALLERLSPTERAAYILREGFDYPYRRIAHVLGLSEANARQLVTRARLRLINGRRGHVDGAEHQQLRDAIIDASQTGELTMLERLLAGEVLTRVPVAVAA